MTALQNAPPARHRLLVVDDDQDSADSICEFIGLSSNWDTEAACGADDAISRAELHPPDMVLVEIEMQGENGFAFASRLWRASERHPVLLSLTGNYRLCTEAAMDSRFSVALMKPLDTGQLLQALASFDEMH